MKSTIPGSKPDLSTTKEELPDHRVGAVTEVLDAFRFKQTNYEYRLQTVAVYEALAAQYTPPV